MKLSYYDINGKLYHHEIAPQLVCIGRDPTMDLCLIDPTVSGSHASITVLNGTYYLTDMNSTNGTRLNGVLIHRQALSKGDHIQLGEFSLWFELPEAQKKTGKFVLAQDKQGPS